MKAGPEASNIISRMQFDHKYVMLLPRNFPKKNCKFVLDVLTTLRHNGVILKNNIFYNIYFMC